jgi:hypothetical protein
MLQNEEAECVGNSGFIALLVSLMVGPVVTCKLHGVIWLKMVPI